jgi:hypothetical protein
MKSPPAPVTDAAKENFHLSPPREMLFLRTGTVKRSIIKERRFETAGQ